jgi:hypothetical protein
MALTYLRPDLLECLYPDFRYGVDFIKGRIRVCHIESRQILEFDLDRKGDINMAILVAANELMKIASGIRTLKR